MITIQDLIADRQIKNRGVSIRRPWVRVSVTTTFCDTAIYINGTSILRHHKKLRNIFKPLTMSLYAKEGKG